jgi:signal transduction histidine kinase
MTALMVLFWLVPSDAMPGDSHKFLVLFSFNQDHPFTNGIRQGFDSRLAAGGFDGESSYEYLDARRYVGPEYERILSSLLQHKYGRTQFDVIVTAGNFAFNYLSTHRDMFPSAPWIFCDINEGVYRRGIDSHGQVTGLISKLDINATLEAALRLHPDRNLVYAIIDNFRGARASIRLLKSQVREFKDRAEIRIVEAPTLAEFAELLKAMPATSLLFISHFARDREGNYFSFREVRNVLREHGRVPVYTLWADNLGDGIVGGKLVESGSLGRGAAEMALRVVHGEKAADNIPVVHGMANQYMFNYNELTRFGVPLSALPAGSVVRNTPPSFYTINKAVIWWSSGGVVFLLFTTLFLAFTVAMRKRAEKALAVSNARLAEEYEQRKLLSSHLIDMLERDRRDVAMELHDHIGQILTTLKLSLAAFKNGPSTGEEEFKRFKAGMEDKMSQVMKGIKNTVQGLRPMTLELQGLKSALQSLVAEMEESSGMKIHFFCEGITGQMECRKEMALFRIAQEAMNNAAKHAGAGNMHMHLSKQERSVSLSIEDDGCGFNVEAVLKSRGAKGSFGLVLMRERALQVGGEFQVDSSIGKGTSILVNIPIT